MTIKRGLLWIIAMWFCLVACDMAGQPEVELNDARLTKADFEKASFELLFGLRNPFPVEVSFTSITYQLELSDKKFFSGQVEQIQTLEARTKSDFSFSVEIRYADALFSLVDMVSDSEIPYRISGSFTFKTPVGDRQVDFVREGSFTNPLSAGPGR